MDEEAREKLTLQPGDVIKKESWRAKGSMAQTDIYKYSIVDSQGVVVGTVDYEDHTSLNGFKRTRTLTQYDLEGNVVVNKNW